MQVKRFKNISKILIVATLVLLLVSVRAFEVQIFYDPFYDYFKNDYLNLTFPEFDALPLFISMGFRYWLNTALSLAIVHILFQDFKLTGFASVLYAVFFVTLMTVFFVLTMYSDSSNNFIIFYVRRFLIQPIFLLLFLPAFYYQKNSTKK